MPLVGIDGLHPHQRIGVSAALVPREISRNGNARGNVAAYAGNGKHIQGGPKGQVHFKAAIGNDFFHIQLGFLR